MSNTGKEIGLAIIGCGTIGRIRARFARDYPAIKWLGVCDIDEKLGKSVAEESEADFFTTDFNELVNRPEVNAIIIATDENKHVDPVMASIATGSGLFIEKPLATDPDESQKIYDAIKENNIDAVIGYTNRFRRRFQAVKGKLVTGQIGDVTTVCTRAFMNRMVPIATIRRTNERHNLTPMVVSGTHSLDMSLWLMEGKKPVSLYAQSVDKVLSQWGTKDSTLSVFTMDDGTIFSMNISWALPTVWPGAVYGLQVGIVGEKGVIDVEDTHRDMVMATSVPQPGGYMPDGFKPEADRHVEFMTSYPAGDINDGNLWGPMREETNNWFARISMGVETPHATAEDGNRNLLLTMAMDLSAKTGEVIKLPENLIDLFN
jgi:predicted dehydrogenase